MKRMSVYLGALAVALYFSVAPTFAQHGGGHGGGMGPSGGGMGGSMGRGSDMGGNRGPHGMGGRNMGGDMISHNSPTTMLSSHPKLASTLEKRLGPMLPSGMSMTDAASGFKNLGQFISAVHVSHNLDIPFSDMKAKMTSGDSLGKAIKQLKPEANSKAEARKGKRQANDDLKSVEAESQES